MWNWITRREVVAELAGVEMSKVGTSEGLGLRMTDGEDEGPGMGVLGSDGVPVRDPPSDSDSGGPKISSRVGLLG